MENFTPYSALAGGMLIGVSVSILLFFNGRILGVSGILSATVFAHSGDWAWRFLFLIGMIAGATTYQILVPESYIPRFGFPQPLLVIGGLLVGLGTRMGGGCTSGHGICGVSRFSRRSLVATCVFMLFGGISVYVVRHVAGIIS